MIQNDKYLKESIDILNRKFGEPLPTLEDTMKAHKLKKESKTRTFGTALKMAWKEQNKKKRKSSFGKKTSRSRVSTTRSRSSCFG